MYKKEELLEMGRKLAQVCRETRGKPSLNLQYLAATSELAGYIKALQLSGIIDEEEMVEMARFALGIEEKREAPILNIPSAFAEFIGGLNLNNLGSERKK